VVVRYFGGVLLGTGGLTTAYKEATIDALCNATIIDKNIEWDIDITFNYLQMNDVMKIIKDTNATIIQQQFDNVCLIKLRIENINFDETLSKLKNTYDLKIGDYPQK
jgi:putative IMPACT (imprinted ancient) family translation regulator